MKGKGVVVTGGAGDLGSTIAAGFVKQGAMVTLLDLKTPDEAEPWVKGVREHGEVRYVQADVTDRRAIREVLARVDPLDIAVGNAAITASTPFLEIEEEAWREQIEVNLTGCFNFGQAAARIMVDQGRPGSILFIGSWIQDIPQLGAAAYSASKAGVRMLARGMALELGEHRIRVNVVAPGIVNAGMAKKQIATEPDYARRASRIMPLGELQTAEQVSQAVSFLCSEAAEAITGAVLLVDGGASLFKFE